MLAAVVVFEKLVAPRFGASRRALLADPSGRRVFLPLDDLYPEELPARFRELGATDLVCDGIHPRCAALCRHVGLKLHAGVRGAIEERLAELFAGTLRSTPIEEIIDRERCEKMPNLDHRGPRGAGPRTGRGRGRCGHEDHHAQEEHEHGPGRGRGACSGEGRGRGRGRGFGRADDEAPGLGFAHRHGAGHGRGAGRGRGRCCEEEPSADTGATTQAPADPPEKEA